VLASVSRLKQIRASIRRRYERGAAMIEFALISLIMIPFALGTIEFSIALLNQAVLASATREGAQAGARYVLVSNSGDATNDSWRKDRARRVTEAVLENNAIPLGTLSSASVASPEIIAEGGSEFLVVSADYTFIGLWFLSGGITLNSSTKVRYERRG
jgi:Flp pilus assembly protein TadG